MVFKGISSHQYIFQKFCFTWNADDDRFVELLIKAGADVNHRDMHGGSVMHWAAHKASDKIANTLIKSGVEDVSVQDHTGKTPLYYAKSTGNSMVYLSWKKSIWTLFFHFYSIHTGNSKFEKVVLDYLASGNAVMRSNVELLLLAIGVSFIAF